MVFNDLYIQEITCHFALEEEQHLNMYFIRIKCRGGVYAKHKIMGCEIFHKHETVKFSFRYSLCRNLI